MIHDKHLAIFLGLLPEKMLSALVSCLNSVCPHAPYHVTPFPGKLLPGTARPAENQRMKNYIRQKAPFAIFAPGDDPRISELATRLQADGWTVSLGVFDAEARVLTDYVNMERAQNLPPLSLQDFREASELQLSNIEKCLPILNRIDVFDWKSDDEWERTICWKRNSASQMFWKQK
jgi:hypothetical protein